MSVAQDTYLLCKNIIAFLTGQCVRRQDLLATEARLSKQITDSAESTRTTLAQAIVQADEASADRIRELLANINERFDAIDAALVTPPEPPQEPADSIEIIPGLPIPRE
jgi:hypothetical protein